MVSNNQYFTICHDQDNNNIMSTTEDEIDDTITKIANNPPTTESKILSIKKKTRKNKCLDFKTTADKGATTTS